MNRLSENILGKIAFFALIIFLIAEGFIPTIVKTEKTKLPIIKGAYAVTFPYEEYDIEFGDGWLGQGEGEPYRWIRKDSSFYARLSDQTYISVTCLVTGDCDVTRAELYANGKLIMETDAAAGQVVTLEGSIDRLIKKNKRNEIKIVFDKERIPDENSPDQRVFSAAVYTIDLQ